MNNKDKCINSLDKLYQEASFGSLEKAKLIGHYQTVFKRISQPTLDDAIAVVEKKRQEFMRDVYPEYASIVSLYDDILTALRGLKEGK